MPIKEIVTDERGSLSAARVLLSLSLLFIAVIIIRDSTILDVPEPAYVLLGSVGMGLLAWAAGPRIAQYVGPQIAGVASGIAKAVKAPRRPELLDNSAEFREDDEK